jgi:hypothetical protein
MLPSGGNNNALENQPPRSRSTAVIALVIIIAAAWSYLGSSAKPPDPAAFVEPSQSVRW